MLENVQMHALCANTKTIVQDAEPARAHHAPTIWVATAAALRIAPQSVRAVTTATTGRHIRTNWSAWTMSARNAIYADTQNATTAATANAGTQALSVSSNVNNAWSERHPVASATPICTISQPPYATA